MSALVVQEAGEGSDKNKLAGSRWDYPRPSVDSVI